MAAYVDGIFTSFLDCILQSKDNGLLTRGRVHLAKIGKDVFWQKTLLVYLERFERILKWKEEVIPVRPKPDM